MKTFDKAVLILAVLCLSIGCDQVTKAMAKEHLVASPRLSFLSDVFRLEYTENTGAFLGLGSSLPEPVRFGALVGVVGGVLAALLWFVWTSQELTPLSTLSWSLVAGGGLSNLITRITHGGAVVDFMNLGIGRLRTGVFNVADLAIMAGGGLLLLSSGIFEKPREEGSAEQVGQSGGLSCSASRSSENDEQE
jgi:signal peptidase II